MTEKRSGRKSEEIMMGKIDSLITSMGKQDIKLAIIETKSIATEEHLKILNGKVQAHESRLQVQEGNLALNTSIIASITSAAKETKSFWERNWEKLFWFVLACSWAYYQSKL